MVRIGLVGIGFMGRTHFLASAGLREARIAAVCSRDPAKLAGDWTRTRGNFGPEPGFVDLTGVKTYADFADMLADPEIDLIDICAPNHLHAELAIRALDAGKHVLVEKAIALTVADADRMLAAAGKSGRLLMVAHVLPFFAEFAFAADAVRNGEYGKLLGGHFRRIISRPDWSPEMADDSKSGGPAVDLHIHDTHLIGLLAGVPQAVFSSGVVEGDAVVHLTTSYIYPGGSPALTCSSGALAAKARPFAHGYELYLERATLVYESGSQPLTILHADGTSALADLSGYSSDPLAAFAAELQVAVDAVRTGVEPRLLSGQLARDALAMCLKECDSVRSGKVVRIASEIAIEIGRQ